MKLNGKTIVLTGATGGIGQELARQLADIDVTLILQGRNTANLTNIISSIKGGKSRHTAIIGDLNDESVRTTLITAAAERQHNLHALINAAGLSDFGAVQNIQQQKLDALFQTNVIVPILLCRDFLPLLESKAAGQLPRRYIVNIGSTFGSIGYAGFTTYCSTKFALRGFSEALRRELADSNVGVKYIAPRATKTNMNSSTVDELNSKLGNKIDSPAWVAKEIIIAIQNEKRRDEYLGWPEKFFAKLNQMAPSVVDKALAGNLTTIKSFFN